MRLYVAYTTFWAVGSILAQQVGDAVGPVGLGLTSGRCVPAGHRGGRLARCVLVVGVFAAG